MKKLRRTAILIMTIILATSMTTLTYANTVSLSKITATIDSQLQTILQDAASNERIPVDIWLYETSTEETRQQKIHSKIGLNKEQILSDTKSAITSEKIDEYIAVERTMYAEERQAQYSIFRLDYAKVQGLQETRQADTRLFYSQYAPMISAELTPKEIKLLACDSRVESIYYSPDVTFEAEGDISIPLIRANYIRDTLGYTGSGIKIGLLEADGLPEKDDDYFTVQNITYDDTLSEIEYSIHAKMVAAIMIGKSTTSGVTYKGIVPDAKLYATYYESGNAADWRERVEWLLSQKVNVINMSAGISGQPTGEYSTLEKWLDHVAINHSVHFVKSAGNNNGEVTSPGMAYNILTVGAINDKNTPIYGDDDRYYEYDIDNNEYDGSSYIEDINLTNKPDLMAPGVNITTAGYIGSGTSLAAPHVTAVIAQLCQRRPALKVQQDAMKAILTASIPHSKLAYTTNDDEYEQFGAGVVDARSAYYTTANDRYRSDSFAKNSADGAEKTYTFTVSSTDEKIRVSLSWLKYATLSQTEATHPSENPATTSLANLSLLVYAPNGIAPLIYSASQYWNTEIVEFSPQVTGTYRIVVKQVTHSDAHVYFAVAWW